ncbi:hypothetical protein [Kribbella voronezhensis]|nr:hypothetical protein [Kribbella voronezhensis]
MVGKNILVVGQPRVGFLADGRADTPYIAAQLIKTDDGDIEISIPWVHGEESHPQRDWFGAATFVDADGPRASSDPPDAFEFHDHNGSVVLVGCRVRTWNAVWPSGVGVGILASDYAVLGARGTARYSRLNGLRSQVEGLGAWVGLHSLDAEQKYSPDGRLESASLHLKAPDSIRISKSMNLTIRPSYLYGSGEHPDETTISERMLVETQVKNAREWRDHLAQHEAVRDLVRIAAWRRFTFQGHQATRNDDPARTLDGKAHGQLWYPVETSLTKIAAPLTIGGGPLFLFHFDDVGSRGVARWLGLRDRMARAIDPILSLLDLQGAPVSTHVAQLGIGLEALGFLLALEKGVSESAAGKQHFYQRLGNIADSCCHPLPVDRSSWIKSMSNLYNGVKHANREMPEFRDLADGYWQSILVFRWWLAGRLGVKRRVLVERLTWDSVARRALPE